MMPGMEVWMDAVMNPYCVMNPSRVLQEIWVYLTV